jgi:hypothetical protein
MLYYLLVSFLLLAILYLYFSKGKGQLGGASKCYTCETQDFENGIYRDYGSKCFSCETQDRSHGIVRGYGSKWF